MRLKPSKEFIIGITVLISLALLVWGLNYLKGLNIFEKNIHYSAIYKKIEGLTVSNPVLVNGYKVGQVTEVKFHPSMDGRVLVIFNVTQKEFKIPKGTIAKITSLDLLGSKSIDLIVKQNATEFYVPGDTLPSEVEASLSEEVNNQILPLKVKAEDLLSSVDTLLNALKLIFNEDVKQGVDKNIKNLTASMESFRKMADKMDMLVQDRLTPTMAHLQSVSFNLRNNNENITQILDNVAFITDSIALSDITSTINNAGVAFKSAASIMEKVERGEGSMGQLVNNDSLYLHLEAASKDLDKLLVDLKEHPNRYVHFSLFGRKDKELKRKEKELKKQRKAEKRAARKED